MQHHGFPWGVFQKYIFPNSIQGKRRPSRQDPQELRRQLHHAEEADKGFQGWVNIHFKLARLFFIKQYQFKIQFVI